MTKPTKVMDGVYQVGDVLIYRDGAKWGRAQGRWFLSSKRIQGQPRFRKLGAAVVAARVYMGEEIDELDRTILQEGAI